MKKLIILTSIVFGMTIGALAQGGGLFGRGETSDRSYGAFNRDGEGSETNLILPSSHNSDHDAAAPLSDGAILLIGFGAAFIVASKLKTKK